jgi:hypothetical protein
MYNVKIKVTHENNLTTLLVLKTNNRTQGEAQNYATRVIAGWESVKHFQIIEVSTRVMILNTYLVEIKLFYKNAKPRFNKLKPKGETPEEAALIADEIINEWPKWKEYEILNISEL